MEASEDGGVGSSAVMSADVDVEGDTEGESAGIRRKHRRSEEIFRAGRSHAPHKRAWMATCGDIADCDNADADGDADDVVDAPRAKRKPGKGACGCRTVLAAHKASFDAMQVSSKTLKKRQRYKPASDTRQYRDMNAQNNWLLANVFDSVGNYLYCMTCIVDVLGVNNKRLTRLRKMKTEGKTKVSHKHAGKASNNSKKKVEEEFIKFLDCNRVPNGRRIGATSAAYFFDPVFDSFRAPDKNDPHNADKCKRSVVAQLNLSQVLAGRPTVCNQTAQRWRATHRHDTVICPLKTDYCDRCKEYYEQINRAQTTVNHLHESGGADPDILAGHKRMAESYRKLLSEHKVLAQKCVDEYKLLRNKSAADYEAITELEQSGEDQAQLEQLKEQFVAVIDADYQMSKLLPHWGYLAQPGSSYYKMKLAHDIMGVVFHSSPPSNFLYVFHEGMGGSKCSDHTISCLDNVFMKHLPPWIKHIVLVLDNAQINKNQYVVTYLGELVRRQRFTSVRFMLLIPGHTKFIPDSLFARLAHSYIGPDVFTTKDLIDIAARYGTATELSASLIKSWKTSVTTSYNPVPNIKDIHDFLWVYQPEQPERHYPSLCVRNLCFDGDYRAVEVVSRPEEDQPPLAPPSYLKKGLNPGVGKENLAHLEEMYNRWIPPERRLEVLPPAPPQPVPTAAAAAAFQNPNEPVTSLLAQQHQAEQHQKRKCSVPGCNGAGHKNKKRWAEGHSTKAGCPIFHNVSL